MVFKQYTMIAQKVFIFCMVIMATLFYFIIILASIIPKFLSIMNLLFVFRDT